MTVERFARKFGLAAIGALALMACAPSPALAQGDHDHMHGLTAPQPPLTPEQKKQQGALVEAVRRATARFQNVENAKPDYALVFGCVSGGDFGAMGMHFLNGSLLGDGDVNVNYPEILLYEPLPNGRLQLTGADYLVDAAEWDSNPKHSGPPELMGQLFHFFDAPNRFGLKPFYTLHVWAWKDNPNGTFTNWNPNVSCDAFNPQEQ
jgi:hypothetical protein